jgi:putative ATP-binding cassette transporter
MTTADTSTTPQGATTSQLMRFLARESGRPAYRIAASSIVSGLSRGLLLATFNAAAALAAAGAIDYRLLAVFGGALVVHLATKYDSGYRGIRLVRGVIQRLRLELCEKLLFSQLRFVERKGAATVYAHISSDITQLGQAAMTFIRNIEAAIVLVFALIYLGWLSLPGLVAGLLVLVVSVAIYRVQDRKAVLKLREARAKEDAFFKGVYDLVRGFKELKLNRAAHESLADHLSKVSREYRRLSVAGAALHEVTVITSEAFIFALIALLVFVLPPFFPSASANVFQFLATVLFMIAPVETLLNSANPISQARIALGRIETLENDLNAGIVDSSAQNPVFDPFAFDTIELKGVHYSFEAPDGEGVFELGPLDLKLNRGEVLFICGGNGAGKTTLLKLLTGLYYPDSGQLLVDGEPVASEDRQRYREIFAAVFGDFYLFHKLYGIDDPDPEYVDALLDELHLSEKTRLEKGGFTTIDLSAGQRKRLAYAVSRLSDRQVYVFDEFAADQDPGFRRYFYEAIIPELKRQGKTVIAVTHDDRWFTAGDRLVKLDYGKITEDAATPEQA